VKRDLLDIYVCPLSRSPLKAASGADSAELVTGKLVSPAGHEYSVEDGIPSFVPATLSKVEHDTQVEYDATADQKYDAAVDWLFRSFYENEDDVRERMVDGLRLTPESRVLEIGCGTGRDTFRIARRLGPRATLFAQDLSGRMVLKTRERLTADRARLNLSARIEYFVSTARFLPFPDGFFDAVFHFGGFNNFSEPKKTLGEMTRIVKKGGRVVVGDESLPPWLEGTEFGEIVVTNNALFKHKVPLEALPENAREVTVRWILGGCFYLFDYTVGEGPPPLDLDLPHKGWRGGTMRTRYFGRLEGVTVEARKLAIEAAKARGVSVHEWLDTLVKRTATADLANASDARAKT
jgi:ubiquinone/menaquinone biosynthesis C-methylase UbiE